MPKSADAGSPDVEASIDALYRGALDRFTADRNALAVTLKKAGDKAAAERVKALAKPSSTAWAVNQAWWQHQDRFQAMLDAGAAQRKAHVAWTQGRQADVRAAREARRAAVSEVTEAARVEAAQTRLAQYETSRQAEGEPPKETVFLFRSPISGVVAESHATAGASVEEGESLYRIVAVDVVHVVASVPEAEAVRLRQVTGGEIELPGLDRPLALGRLVSIGRIVDPASRTLSVITEASNSRRLLSIGQAVSLRLFVSGQSKGVAVRETAIIDDAGRPVVFVQLGGESFQRRPVRLGNREAGYIEVVEGIKLGERVVKRGAYLIRLAALSTQIPAHGHVH
jgi:RND family efflux transporter MFP subunit